MINKSPASWLGRYLIHDAKQRSSWASLVRLRSRSGEAPDVVCVGSASLAGGYLPWRAKRDPLYAVPNNCKGVSLRPARASRVCACRAEVSARSPPPRHDFLKCWTTHARSVSNSSRWVDHRYTEPEHAASQSVAFGCRFLIVLTSARWRWCSPRGLAKRQQKNNLRNDRVAPVLDLYWFKD